MMGRYRDVVLGKNLLPPWFEKRLVGLKQGQRTRFRFTFPKDSTPAELQNKTARFWVNIHKVLNPVAVTSVKQLKSMNTRNRYGFAKLDDLPQENEVLYHLALREVPEQDLVIMPAHFLAYMYHYARLRNTEYVRRARAWLSNDKQALNALAETLYLAGMYLEAGNYYGESGSDDVDTLIKKARSLFLGGEVQNAMKMLNSIPRKGSLSFKELLLECLKVLEPHSERIHPLDRDVLRLRVEASLQKETSDQNEGSLIEPIAYGDESRRRSSSFQFS